MRHVYGNAGSATISEQQALEAVKVLLGRSDSPTHLVGSDNEPIPLPDSLAQLLSQAAELMSHGRRVALAPVDDMLSTQQAADLLNVSRPYLVKLLDTGAIQSTKVGRNRRVDRTDFMRYMASERARRRAILTQMVRDAEEAGLYDLDIPLAPTR
jgi:excisionase family DNA binding protein